MKEESTSQKPSDGVYVRGFFCEAGQWNPNEGLLEEALRGELSSPMPTIWFNPKDQLPPRTEWREEGRDQHGRPLATGVYHCPLYPASQNRKIICHVALPTNKPQSHWIRRGTALFLGQDN
jgi:dynein heavy chain